MRARARCAVGVQSLPRHADAFISITTSPAPARDRTSLTRAHARQKHAMQAVSPTFHGFSDALRARGLSPGASTCRPRTPGSSPVRTRLRVTLEGEDGVAIRRVTTMCESPSRSRDSRKRLLGARNVSTSRRSTARQQQHMAPDAASSLDQSRPRSPPRAPTGFCDLRAAEIEARE